jgi:alpha-glucuronidase
MSRTIVHHHNKLCAAAIFSVIVVARAASAQTSGEAWLQYAPIADPAVRATYDTVPDVVVAIGDSEVIRTAREELVRGLRSMLGREFRGADPPVSSSIILIGNVKDVRAALPITRVLDPPAEDGFWIGTVPGRRRSVLAIAGRGDRGVLYGSFELLRRVALHRPVFGAGAVLEAPAAPNRFVRMDLTEASDHARLLASIGINGVVDSRADRKPTTSELERIEHGLAAWGVRVASAGDAAGAGTVELKARPGCSSDLAMATLYRVGRLAWKTDLSASTIEDEWGKLSFGHDPQAAGKASEILKNSGNCQEKR